MICSPLHDIPTLYSSQYWWKMAILRRTQEFLPHPAAPWLDHWQMIYFKGPVPWPSALFPMSAERPVLTHGTSCRWNANGLPFLTRSKFPDCEICWFPIDYVSFYADGLSVDVYQQVSSPRNQFVYYVLETFNISCLFTTKIYFTWKTVFELKWSINTYM